MLLMKTRAFDECALVDGWMLDSFACAAYPLQSRYANSAAFSAGTVSDAMLVQSDAGSDPQAKSARARRYRMAADDSSAADGPQTGASVAQVRSAGIEEIGVTVTSPAACDAWTMLPLPSA